jgi:thiosulfate:glutathione sulfurtransferase
MSVPIVTKSELEKKIKEEKGTFKLIDVRGVEESKDTLIPTAVVIPLPDFADVGNLSNEEFESKYKFSKPQADEKIIIYCRSGARAGKACETLIQLGYKDVSNYKGSALEWFA